MCQVRIRRRRKIIHRIKRAGGRVKLWRQRHVFLGSFMRLHLQSISVSCGLLRLPFIMSIDGFRVPIVIVDNSPKRVLVVE